ncbi:MAG: secretion protein [Pelagibacterales bacterium MED-G44]|nr:MAG: secretion protein [Pelagibacterales bacterium MED-G44]
MSLIKKILMVFFILLPIPHSFANMVTFVQSTITQTQTNFPGGVHFKPDGTKMFVLSASKLSGDYSKVSEFNLSTPFDLSTSSYAGDGESCILNSGNTTTGPVDKVHGLKFSKNGMMMFVARGRTSNDDDADLVFRFDLTSPFDISTCSFANQTTGLDTTALQNGSNAGVRASGKNKNYIRGFDISGDGKKLFVVYHGQSSADTRLLEYELATAFDLSSDISLVTNAGIDIATQVTNPKGIKFSPDGKRLFTVDHQGSSQDVSQFTLDVAYSTSSFSIDGTVSIESTNDEPVGITFSTSGLKMFVGRDNGDGERGILKYDLVCPFNIIAGKCPPITENKDRTGIAMAQIEIAKRSIDQSTDTALNRLKWIRRNKDKQNLTNLNINFNFTNQRLASLTEVVRTSAAKKKKKDKDNNRDIFYWSEGSVAIGRVGDTSISSTKEINTNRITVGADRFIDDKALRGLAFSVGRSNVDVGNMGSNVDADTYNLTYYSTSPMKDDEKFVDTIIGIGKIHSDILTVLDSKELTANRRGKQIFGTIKIKDEIKGDKFTLIPSGRFDIGHTLLDDYEEVGNGGIIVEKQHVRTKNLRAALAAVEEISNDKYTIKRHGKIEYRADIDRSSDFKYKYKEGSGTLTDTLHVGALHNISGELGIDIVFPENYSIFIIYERDQAIDYGHTDNLHIALGYLPNKNTNIAIQLEGINNTESNYVFSKNINDFILDFKLSNDLMNPTEYQEAAINLTGKF